MVRKGFLSFRERFRALLLESCGLISRTVYPVVPPMVEYELTEIGKSLEEAFDAIHRWGIKYLEFTSTKGLTCPEEGMD